MAIASRHPCAAPRATPGCARRASRSIPQRGTGTRRRTGSTSCPASCCCTVIVIIPLVWNVYLTLHRVARHPPARVHRARELGRARSATRTSGPRSRNSICDDRRDGRACPRSSASCSRPCSSTSSAGSSAARLGELPARHLLPAADPARRDRRHRDRLDPAPGRTARSTRCSRRSGSASSRRTGSADPDTALVEHHGRARLGAARLPDRHLHGRAPARRPRALRSRRARRRELVPAVPRDHAEHHPSRDLRRHAHLHDRRAEGVRTDLRAHRAAGPAGATIVPAYYAYSEFFQAQQVGYGATIATALTIVIGVVSVVFIRVQNSLGAEGEGREPVTRRTAAALDASVQRAEAGAAPPRRQSTQDAASTGCCSLVAILVAPAHRRAVPSDPHQLVQVARPTTRPAAR